MKKITTYLLILICIVSCEKDVFTGLVENPIPSYSKIFISSNPGGYKIFIDDKNTGVVSPDTVLYLTEGQHKLHLRHDYYSDTTLTITVDKSPIKIISVDMLKNPRFFANLTLSSIPSSAKIYLNDRLVNNILTPTTIKNVYPGNYEIKLSKKDCRDDSTNIIVKGGEHLEIQRLLEDTSRTVSYRTNNSKISSNQVNKVVVDKYNNKWIGTIDHGLVKYDGKNWTSFENNGVIEGSRIQDLLVDRNGKLWIASIKGLFTFDGYTWMNMTNYLPSNNVISLDEDLSGNIWIATINALVKYNGASFQVFNSENTNVQFLNLSSVACSNNGDIWVGTSGSGILRFHSNSWTNITTVSMYIFQNENQVLNISDIIKDLIVDKNGNLYSFHIYDQALEVRSALIRFNGAQWEELKLNLLFALDVESFYLDNNNDIWMALNGGLIKYNPAQQLKFYDSDSYGYFSKQCTSFSLDQNGDGWLTTLGGGIAKLKKGFF